MQTLLSVIFSFCILSACESIKKNNSKKSRYDINKLEGSWELNYISGSKIVFEGLFPANKPFIKFDVINKKINGQTGCNHFSGDLVTKDSTIDLSGPILITEMYCPDSAVGEQLFVKTLTAVTSYKIQDTTLFFMTGDVMMMRYVKKSLPE